jgi:transcriptional regulator with XRE-family HTH domain
MHITDTNGKFLELRAKGWSLARIATRIGVSKRTLIAWQHQHRQELRLLRAVELEALQEKILASHKAELTRLARRLDVIELEISRRELSSQLRFVETRDLYRLAALIRDEIRKLRIEPDFTPEEPPQPSSPSGAAGAEDLDQPDARSTAPADPSNADASAVPRTSEEVPTARAGIPEELHHFCTISAPPAPPTEPLPPDCSPAQILA